MFTCLLNSRSRFLVVFIGSFVVSLGGAYSAEKPKLSRSKSKQSERSPSNVPIKAVMKRSKASKSVDFDYQSILDEEKQLHDNEYHVETLASGIATLTIGLYGYYLDDRGGTSIRLAYGAAQTAGILMTSSAIKSMNSPSMLILSDRYLRKRKHLSLENYKRAVVSIRKRQERAEKMQIAVTTGILATLYSYNGYREENASLKNTFNFLAANFTLISISSFYKLHSSSGKLEVPKYEISMGPVSTFTYYF